jgi:hypothetical protein
VRYIFDIKRRAKGGVSISLELETKDDFVFIFQRPWSPPARRYGGGPVGWEPAFFYHESVFRRQAARRNGNQMRRLEAATRSGKRRGEAKGVDQRISCDFALVERFFRVDRRPGKVVLIAVCLTYEGR